MHYEMIDLLNRLINQVKLGTHFVERTILALYIYGRRICKQQQSRAAERTGTANVFLLKNYLASGSHFRHWVGLLYSIILVSVDKLWDRTHSLQAFAINWAWNAWRKNLNHSTQSRLWFLVSEIRNVASLEHSLGYIHFMLEWFFLYLFMDYCQVTSDCEQLTIASRCIATPTF